MKILITGGTGYIGSHAAIELIEQKHDVTILDNLSNSKINVIDNIEKITKIRPKFINVDLTQKDKLTYHISGNVFDAVMHFSGLKAIEESVSNPVSYYRNNINETINLIEIMNKIKCKTMIFSSSASVYGQPQSLPLKKNHPIRPTNPYGRTKATIEDLLKDLTENDKEWRVVSLRYFNPIGAHISGNIGENPFGKPNNLAPFIAQVAVGKRKELNIFGNDYKTPDGTTIRDYIHITDLVNGHIKALEWLKGKENVYETFNLGTGKGHSIYELIRFFEKANKKKISYKISERRKGDLEKLYSDPSKAKEILGWSSKLSIEQACEDHLRWEYNNL